MPNRLQRLRIGTFVWVDLPTQQVQDHANPTRIYQQLSDLWVNYGVVKKLENLLYFLQSTKYMVKIRHSEGLGLIRVFFV